MKFSGYKLNILKMYFYILTTNNKKNKFKISQYKKIKYKEIYWKIRKTSTKKTENITESKEDTEKEIPNEKFNISEYANSAQLIYRSNEIAFTILAYSFVCKLLNCF